MRIHHVLLSTLVPFVAALDDAADIDEIQWNDDRWEIVTGHLHQGQYRARMSLANGYLGTSIASLGPFFEIDAEDPMQNHIGGWPLGNRRQTFATIAGFYDSGELDGDTNYPWLRQYGSDSYLSGIPHWSGLLLMANGAVLNASTSPKEISRFTTRLDMKNGLLKWAFRWTPGNNNTIINVDYEMFVHKLYVNRAAVQVRLESNRNVDLTVYDVIDGTSAVRADFVDKSYREGSSTIWSAVSPRNVPNVTAYVASTLRCDQCGELDLRAETDDQVFEGTRKASVGQSFRMELTGGRKVEITKYIGAASSDAFEHPKDVAIAASMGGADAGFDALRRSHAGEWASVMPPDAVDRYNLPNGSVPDDRLIRTLQLTSVTNPFMILQNTVGPNAMAAADHNPRLKVHSIPVCGLGSDCYGGLIFWDAETWMALGLQLSHPQHIDNIVNYRVDLYPQAKENIKTAFASSKNQTGRFTGGAVFPWTSGRYGNCTASGPCFDYEYHINGDIALAFRNQFIATGDAKQFKETFLPIANDIAYFYGELVDFNETSGYYEIRNATDPDEYANNVDNVGFTTALIQRHLNETNELNTLFGLPQNETWNQISAQMRLPVHEEAGIVMEYASMNGSMVVKQADVVLIDDILNYDNPYSLVDLDYYANKQSPDGPGMTYATFSIVANEISPSGCSSYTYDYYATQPYARAPWFQYSEQIVDNPVLNGGTHPAYPFLTGQGGANRIGIFGYLGLRMYVDRLDVDPAIPPQIPHINYRTFYWAGYGINATSNATHTTLTRLPDRILSTANPAYASKGIPVTLGTRPGSYTLTPESHLTIPNRMLGQTRTVARNILQCKRILPNPHQRILPGQFALAAIDGASSTKWQPADASKRNYIAVDTSLSPSSSSSSSKFARIERVLLDWGQQPPVSFDVYTTNGSVTFTEDGGIAEMETGTETDADADAEAFVWVAGGDVEASEPWDPERALDILPVKGNQTNVTLVGEERVWGGRYVVLGIRGNMGGKREGVGATVAEWSVVLEEGEEDEDAWRGVGMGMDGALGVLRDGEGERENEGEHEREREHEDAEEGGELKMRVQGGWMPPRWRSSWNSRA